MLTPQSPEDTPQWFVLNYVANSINDSAAKVVRRYNDANASNLEIFAPTYVVKTEKDGNVKMKKASLTFHYVFVKGGLPTVKSLCSQANGFSFLIDHSSQENRYAVISDRDMANFQTIARAYKNCLPYFSLDDIDLEEGDLVEVINGDFPGLVGTYMPKPKSNSGNIVLNVYNNVGTIAFNVKASDVRVLEFSKCNTRANDQIDAFVPHLYRALRLYHAGEPLTPGLAAKLSVFCSRMNSVKLNNRKLNARLQALLYGANTILGNTAEARVAKEKFEKLRDDITNPWTSLSASLILAVADDNAASISKPKAKPSSKAQTAVIDEYAHYLQK